MKNYVSLTLSDEAVEGLCTLAGIHRKHKSSTIKGIGLWIDSWAQNGDFELYDNRPEWIHKKDDLKMLYKGYGRDNTPNWMKYWGDDSRRQRMITLDDKSVEWIAYRGRDLGVLPRLDTDQTVVGCVLEAIGTYWIGLK